MTITKKLIADIMAKTYNKMAPSLADVAGVAGIPSVFGSPPRTPVATYFI
jgi:hypothetical protein